MLRRPEKKTTNAIVKTRSQTDDWIITEIQQVYVVKRIVKVLTFGRRRRRGTYVVGVIETSRCRRV